MNTIALDMSVAIGLEVAAAIGLAWLCWRLGQRRNLIALRDLSRAFVAMAVWALMQLIDLSGFTSREAVMIDLGRSLSVWLYISFLMLGAAELATNNFVTDKVRREIGRASCRERV